MTCPKNLVISFKSRKVKFALSKWIVKNYKLWIEGFFTEELKQGSSQRGFVIETMGGTKEILASVDMISRVSFNKYAVNMNAFETAAAVIKKGIKEGKILLMDEIGSISLKSASFMDVVCESLASPNPCCIFVRSETKIFEGVLSKIADTQIVKIDENNCENLKIKIDKWFEFWLKAVRKRKNL